MNKFLINYFQRKTNSGKFIQEIDGLRFFALVPVLIHHLAERVIRQKHLVGDITSIEQTIYDFLPTGTLGVEIFFVISGFVISLPLISKWNNTFPAKQPFGFKKYFIRRLTRLEPPYLLLLIIVFLALTFFITGDNLMTSGTESFKNKSSISLTASLMASVFYLHGIIYSSYPRINPPAWSLEIEFQFYVLAPFLLLVVFFIVRKLNSKKYFLTTLFLITIALKLLALLLFSKTSQHFIVSEYIQYFTLGFALCHLYCLKIFDLSWMKKVSSITFFVSLIAILCLDHLLKDYFSSVLFYNLDEKILMTSLSTVKLLAFVLFFSSVFSGGLGGRITRITWVSTIGGMCYSVYLIHLIVMQVGVPYIYKYFGISNLDLLSSFGINAIIIFPLIMVTSAVFFLIIEKPCMNPNWPKQLMRSIRGFFSSKQSILNDE